MNKPKVFSVYFDVIIKTIKSLESLSINEIDFYKSKHWPARANSTARLNISNYQALELLSEQYEITHYFCTEFSDSLKNALNECDYVIIHQNASKKTFSILAELMAFFENNKINARLIFGTEGTWSTTKDFLTDDNIHDIYFNHTLLRHTAKTDRELYSSPNCITSKVEEFELGIDTELLSFGKPLHDRKYITFVKAPEGRATKNNDAIDHILEELKTTDLMDRFEIQVLVPPYSSEEYWNIMSQTMFFIFVSNGETFSYCLNDAKALGAITLFPNHMYSTKIGARFVVDNYPKSGIRYTTNADLVKKISDLSSNKEKLKFHSEASRNHTIDNFSIEQVSQNWKSILSGRNYRKNKMYIFSDKQKLNEVISFCKKNDFDYAMSYRNTSIVSWMDESFNHHDEISDIVFVKDYLTLTETGLNRSFIATDNSFFFSVGADVRGEKLEETISFFNLLSRIHKIGDIVIDQEIDNELLKTAIDYTI